MTNRLKMPSLRAMALATVVVLGGAFAFAFLRPQRRDQGFVQKIFYLHVPIAICALLGRSSPRSTRSHL